MRLPNKSDSHCGTWGWFGLAVGVIAWDILAPETLTHAFQRAFEHPAGKTLLLGLVGATALHLAGLIEPEHDMFYGFGLIEPYEQA